MIKLIENFIQEAKEKQILSSEQFADAKKIVSECEYVILSQGQTKIHILVEHDGTKHDVEISIDKSDELICKINGKIEQNLTPILLSSLLIILLEFENKELSEGIKYTREGMINRVLSERQERADKAEYKLKLSDNLYGEHLLTNEKGVTFKITLHDFIKKTGYIDNIDWRTNKLATTKHIMYVYNFLREQPRYAARLDKKFPFIDVFTDPLNDYKITWFYPEQLSKGEEKLLKEFFGNSNFIENDKIIPFFSFINKARDFQRIKIREEVFEQVERYVETTELEQLSKQIVLDFSVIKANLYPYQKEGIKFSVFKKGVIIADDMGLGKTLQAIATAIIKKDIFDFKRTLIICPASVKHQWRNEIQKFTDQKATIIQGYPEERAEQYKYNQNFFHIVNYETVLRDFVEINKVSYDFVILDEAQKIKNYATKTSNAVKSITKKHGMVITGTPLENKLLDLFSIVQFLDYKLLSPQWEFSYQHCIFDANNKNKILGYYDLQKLKSKLSNLLIRREKREVFEQLPNVIQKNIYTTLSDEQASMHAGFSAGIAQILSKKFKTAYDWQKLMFLLTNMRMVCDSTYLIDKETNISPKMIELQDILIEQLDLKNTKRKVIIFSEWVTMLHIIADMLRNEGLTFTMLTGSVPVKKRGDLIKEFEENPDCNIFLSSESGGTGLNLQVADTVINFELPWNPAKKNQRIGRIDRIGQQKQKLNVFNLLSYNSIEMKIATGLLLKQSLFDGVLSADNLTDEVDFSNKGRGQFIKQLEEIIEFGFEKEDDIIDEPEIEELEDKQQIIDSEEDENELISTINEPIEEPNEAKITAISEPEHKPEDQKEEVSETNEQDRNEQENIEKPQKVAANFNQMEEVMTKGMEFLTGLYQMSTGNNTETLGKPKVKMNKETGEVSITFKMA